MHSTPGPVRRGPTPVAVILYVTVVAVGVTASTTRGLVPLILAGVTVALVTFGEGRHLKAMVGSEVAVEAPRWVWHGSTVGLRFRYRTGRHRLAVTSAGARGRFVRLDPGQDGDVELVANERLLIGAIRSSLHGYGPIGLTTATIDRDVQMARPLAVVPRPIRHHVPGPPPRSVRTEADRLNDGGDVATGVRPYRPGDPRRTVHWPTTARAGELHVRTFESPKRPRVRVAIAFSERGGAADETVGRAHHAVLALRSTYEVELTTWCTVALGTDLPASDLETEPSAPDGPTSNLGVEPDRDGPLRVEVRQSDVDFSIRSSLTVRTVSVEDRMSLFEALAAAAPGPIDALLGDVPTYVVSEREGDRWR